MNTYRNFGEFFEKATGFKPYPYQKRLAEAAGVSVINMPTGTGKTETAILGLWLWKRIQGENIPRRLVYCLPMRVLVEQTHQRIKEWMERLDLDIDVEIFMGGSENHIRDLHPEKPCIILGTQDMLVSAALNRAYGNSPYSWPIAFGLLNNDCMWIMDEVQMMENALPTSIQLDHFRREFGTYGPHKTVWMSATINPEWMRTVDAKAGGKIFKLEKGDADEKLQKRNKAPKTLQKLEIALEKTYTKQDVEEILNLHQKETVTVVIVNTVRRAQEIYLMLTKMTKTECVLIHSRFRFFERKKLNEWLGKLEEKDVIIVATQVLEAGVDISAKTMITELAPWPNMVQRFGRCNRYGKEGDSKIHWIDVTEKDRLPYDESDMGESRKQVEKLIGKSVAPADLPDVKQPKFSEHVLRYKDIMELFDTTADLSGNRTDVSHFVRTGKKRNSVSVYWRDDAADCMKNPKFKPDRDELCEVPIYEIRAFFKNKKQGHTWNYAERRFERVNYASVRPGQTILLDAKTGGYSEKLGWDGKSCDITCIPPETQGEPESHDADSMSSLKKAVTLEEHTSHVCAELELFLKGLDQLKELAGPMRIAAKYHDIGKAHHIFQEILKQNITDKRDEVWAKSQLDGRVNYTVRGFRHEVASALAYLAQGRGDVHEDLIAYLIMSHHGKVRLSLRSVSRKTETDGRLLGIKTEGDELPAFKSGPVSIEKTQINIKIASIGHGKSGRSWIERTSGLLGEYRPFRLAFLEAVLRRADTLASSKEGEDRYE